MAAAHPRRNATLPISFFKIILKTNLQRLKIPNKFTQRYGDALSNPVCLKSPDGKEWKVWWTKQSDSEVWFEKGWKEFAENYSLDHGYLVVFKYKGGVSQFDVKILGQSALEIDYPYTCDDESVEILGEWPGQKHSKQKSQVLSPPPCKKARGDETPAQRTTPLPLNVPREARAKEVADSFISKSNNPFFTVTIKPSNLLLSRVYVPDLEGYVENNDKIVKLQIREESRSWDVKMLRRHPSNGRRFSAGWLLFARENELKEGDVCVFELINQEDSVFKVHVF